MILTVKTKTKVMFLRSKRRKPFKMGYFGVGENIF